MRVNVSRESLADWRSILQNIMESSAAATAVVLNFLSDVHMQLVEEALICAQVGPALPSPACLLLPLDYRQGQL